ncbi:putative proteophosphoglycan ppg3 [Leptomonas seymouri]|uniref:non-specific serine/threonine protein kinase n=1 Tax=Leptomonas seymouri TaxID=5684 RepID=A0A0N1I121_LEPSE|nr:putative proteophosphoglycan ppg3 [Leptomonas seymouri]|eukprot:KPI88603.1 putative proteophosphoglycan ppg3 [Leptomonas seymouri]
MTASGPVLRSRRQAMWLLAALLAVLHVGASVGAAAGSPSAEVVYDCHGPVPFYTRKQIESTSDFLLSFTEVLYPISNTWGCKNFCAWPHIICRPSGLEVNLTSSQSLGLLPEMPWWLVGSDVVVTKFDISGESSIDGYLPPSWSELTSLRYFSAAGTGISGSMPDEWATMENLQHVDLSMSQVTGTIPESWNALTSLRHFSAAGTGISGPIPDEWTAMANLEHVDLSMSQVTGTIPESWSVLTKLRVFRAHGLDIESHLPPSWSALHALTEFDMHNCKLVGSLPESWGALSNLRKLRVNRNRLTGRVPQSYGSMSSIATVSLEENDFCGCLPAAWTSASATVRVTADSAMLASDCDIANVCAPLPSSISSSSSASSSSSDLCDNEVSYFNPEQVAATRTVLSALRDSFHTLRPLWQCWNYCIWAGVACSDDGVTLSLSNWNLVGTLPLVPAATPIRDVMLTSVDLSSNPQITGELTIEWILLPRLRFLNVSGCGLSGNLPA